MFKTSSECQLELVAHTQMERVKAVQGEVMELWHQPSGDDLPARAARASFGKQDKTGENPAADKKLMNFLAEHKHMTPFEYQHATFLIECPLFIRSQIHRHRTFSYNEISRRYTSENLEFWVPDEVRGQAKNNKQASDGLVEDQGIAKAWFQSTAHMGLQFYNDLIKIGVAREQARAALPQSLLTRFYMGGNLRNWAHFIELRRDEHAQQEVRVITDRVAGHLQSLWPESCSALGI